MKATRLRRLDEHSFVVEVEQDVEIRVSMGKGKGGAKRRTGEYRKEWLPVGYYSVTPGQLKMACESMLVEGLEGQSVQELLSELRAARVEVHRTIDGFLKSRAVDDLRGSSDNEAA